MTRFEDDLRNLLHSPAGQPDTEELLRKVHSGAGRRRRRRRTAGAAVVAAAAVGVAGVALLPGQLQPARQYVAAPTPSASATRDSSPSDPPTPSTGTSHPSHIVSVTATSANEWLLLSTRSCGAPGGSCVKLVNSTVGDPLKVSDIPVPDGPGGATTPETADQVRFGGSVAVDGWLFGGGLYSTHDGGASWTHVNLGPDTRVTSLELAGTDQVLALGGDATGVHLFSSRVYRDTWHPVPLPADLDLAASSLMVTQDVQAFVAVTTQGHYVVVHSHDLGDTWDTTEAPCRQVDSAAASRQTLWLTCQADDGAIYRSRDGAEWTLLKKVRVGPGARLAPVSDLSAMLYLRSTAVLVSGTGTEQVRAPLQAGEGIRDASFVDPWHGFLVTTLGRALRSDDGGRSWTAID